MKVKDLISKKDYDYISWRVTPPKNWDDEKSIFVGCAKSEGGKLIALDGDNIYDEEDFILSYEEWCQDDVESGLTVVVKGEWYGEDD